MPSIKPGQNALELAQAQTAIQDAQKYNTEQWGTLVWNGAQAQTKNAGVVQIDGWNAVGSAWAYNPWSVPAVPPVETGALPSTVATPAWSPTKATNQAVLEANKAAAKKREYEMAKAFTWSDPSGNMQKVISEYEAANPTKWAAVATTATPTITPTEATPVKSSVDVVPNSESVIQWMKPYDGDTVETRIANITKSYDEGFKQYDAQVADYDKKMQALQNTINDPLTSADEKALAQQSLNAYNEAKQTAIMNRTQQEENLNTEIENEKKTSDAEEMAAREKNKFLRDYETEKQKLIDDKKRDVERQATIAQQTIDDNIRQNQKDATSAQILGAAVVWEGRMGGRDNWITQGITESLQHGKTLLDRVKQNADWQMTDLVQSYNKANIDIENQFTDAIPKATQDLLLSVSALDQAGRLKTIQDWEMAKRSLAPIINKIQIAQTAKLDAIKSNNALFEKQLDTLKNSKQLDYQASEAQGIFINKNGEPILGADGKPVKYESSAIKSSFMNEKTGQLTILYADGKYQTQQVATPTAQTEWKESSTMPGYLFDPATWNYKPAVGTGIPGAADGTNYQITPGTTQNRPDRNNNPGNIRAWDQWYGVDSGGFTIFASPTDGFNAMVKDVTAKLTGQSKYSSKINTFKDLVSVYAPSTDGNDPTNYANVVAKQLGFTADTPVSQLVQYAPQIAAAMAKHEWFTGTIDFWGKAEAGTPDPNRTSQYINYMEKGTLPTGMKDGSAAAQAFREQAQTGYVAAKNSQVANSWFTISDPNAFVATSPKQKEDISTAIQQVQPFIDSMDRLIAMTKANGTEAPITEVGKKMNAEVKNAQLIAKEIYNLWVLNGPDLSLMETIIQNPTSLGSNLTAWQDYAGLLENAKETILNNAVSKAGTVGLSFVWGQSAAPQVDSTGQQNTGGWQVTPQVKSILDKWETRK